MSLVEVTKDVQTCSDSDRRKLALVLAAMEEERSSEFQQKIEKIIAEDEWVSSEEMWKEMGKLDEQGA